MYVVHMLRQIYRKTIWIHKQTAIVFQFLYIFHDSLFAHWNNIILNLYVDMLIFIAYDVMWYALLLWQLWLWRTVHLPVPCLNFCDFLLALNRTKEMKLKSDSESIQYTIFQTNWKYYAHNLDQNWIH